MTDVAKDQTKAEFGTAALVLAAVGVVLLSINYSRKDETTAPQKMFDFDGCTLYSFKDEGYKHYVAKCPLTGKVSTTYSLSPNTQSHLITENIPNGN